MWAYLLLSNSAKSEELVAGSWHFADWLGVGSKALIIPLSWCQKKSLTLAAQPAVANKTIQSWIMNMSSFLKSFLSLKEAVYFITNCNSNINQTKLVKLPFLNTTNKNSNWSFQFEGNATLTHLLLIVF